MLKLINPKSTRHKDNVKSLFKSALDLSEQLGSYGLAGYAIAAWDGAGNTAIKYKPGGIVSKDYLPTHIYSQLISLNAALDAKGGTVYEN